jgi:hypothetical protein
VRPHFRQYRLQAPFSTRVQQAWQRSEQISTLLKREYQYRLIMSRRRLKKHKRRPKKVKTDATPAVHQLVRVLDVPKGTSL